MTKYRRRVFNNAMLHDCQTTLRQVCDVLGAQVVQFNGEPDHLHLLVRYPPARPISELIHRWKSATARRMRADHHGTAATEPGCTDTSGHPPYYAVSADGAPQSIIKQHIENQDRPLQRAGPANPGLKSRASAEQKRGHPSQRHSRIGVALLPEWFDRLRHLRCHWRLRRRFWAPGQPYGQLRSGTSRG